MGGGNFEKNQSPEIFSALLTSKQGQPLISEWIVQKWVDRYGTNASELIRMFCELALESSEYNLIKAELYYCVAHEAVCTLSDFLIRRTGMLYFEREAIASIYNALNEELAILLQWNEAKKLASLREFEKEYEDCIRFRH